MRTFYYLMSAASSIVGALYLVHAFFELHARLGAIRHAARAEATLRLFVNARHHRALEQRVVVH